MEEISIYIHFPFCQIKCQYCHFYSFSLNKLNFIKKLIFIKKYVRQLICEIEFYSKFLFIKDDYYRKNKLLVVNKLRNYKNATKIKSIYFGGGTPSCINARYINKILRIIKKYFILSNNAEITIEMNPSDINESKIKYYKKIGINRISVGIQSLNENDYYFLGRNLLGKGNILINKNLLEYFNKKLNIIKKYYSNYSLDFVLGLNNFNLELLSSFISSNRIPHLSFYMLMFTGEEEGYIFYKDKMYDIDKLSYKQYKKVQKMLNKHGYIHYEISNFALKEDFFSIHNLNYWQRGYYLGIGASASGFIGYLRYKNFFLDKYMKIDFKKISKNIFYYLSTKDTEDELIKKEYKSTIDDFLKFFYKNIYLDYEILTLKDEINEEIMLGLRLKKGVSIKKLYKKYNFDLLKEKKDIIESFRKKGYIEINKDFLKIRENYFHISNSIISEIFI
ncbi:MAG: radical SAM protein [Spirochaetes bacterium]|nr:radical SAM protein [Spirochaetota bacterium]